MSPIRIQNSACLHRARQARRGGRWCLRRGSGNSKGPLRGRPAHARSHKDRCPARSGFGGVARVEPTDRRMIDVVGKRDLARLCPATRRATARAVLSFAASRRGLAFERAHFSPDPLNGGSPDADGRSRLVDARAAAQKPPDCPFRLGAPVSRPTHCALRSNPSVGPPAGLL